MAIRGLLLDLEGVLYEAGRPVAGAGEAVRQAAAAGLAIRFITNTTTQPRRVVLERLWAMGFAVQPGHLFSPAVAACRLLERDGVTRLHLAAPEVLAEDFTAFELVDAAPQAVVMGDLYKDFTWDHLNQVFQMMRDGARLIALHRNRYCRRAEGIALDLGPFVAALEYAAGVKATVVGKPVGLLFALALADMGLDPAEVMMIGDDLEADIGGARSAGLVAVQVETGKYTPRDGDHPIIRPDAVIPSIAALPDLLGALRPD